jgi:orotate phosphoribosyltransferase
LEILRNKSLKLGHFTLVSGKTSNYYFDSKFTTLDPEGAFLTAALILAEIKKQRIEAEAIGGLTLGADPIVSSVSAVSYALRERFRPLRAFIVRKEPKKHGTERFIEGLEDGKDKPVIIVDDVCTTGGSTLKAVRAAEEAGMKVAAVFCLVDREQGGREALDRYLFHSLFTASELLAEPSIQARLEQLAEPKQS